MLHTFQKHNGGLFLKGVDALANLKQPFFLGDPVDMVTPRSIYNDVYSPKNRFSIPFRMEPITKKLTASFYDIISITITDVMKTLPSSSFPRQEIYEAAKLTKAEVTILHRKAKVFFFS